MSNATATTKRCTKCLETKSTADFIARGRKRVGLRSVCKTCERVERRARYVADPLKHKAACRSGVERNREKSNAIAYRNRERNIERYRERERGYDAARREAKAAYRKANAERIKARNAEYRVKNREKIKASGAAYYVANKAAITVRVAACVARNPDLYKQINKAAKDRRKVRIQSNGPVESFRDREIFERDNWTCGLCGGQVDPALKHSDPMSASLDHIVPIVKGGGHTRSNVQCAHLRCNFIKRDGRPVPAAA